MHAVDVSRLDLNLLFVLAALIERGSVTGAAKQLGLTQPTVSHSLARLRAVLSDPILVRAGRGMIRTPRAEQLGPSVRRLLADAGRLLAPDTGVDMASSTRTFAIGCPDLLIAFLPQLLERFSREAPRARLEARPPPADLSTALVDGAIDLAVLPARADGAGLVQRALGSVHWCVLARKRHPGVVRGALDLATWLRFGHVIVGTNDRTGFVGTALAHRGVERHVAFVAPSFLAAPHAVAHTDWFFAAPRELVGQLATGLGLQVLPPPLAIPAVKVALVWHERSQADAGHRFLRELFAAGLARALVPAAKSRSVHARARKSA